MPSRQSVDIVADLQGTLNGRSFHLRSAGAGRLEIDFESFRSLLQLMRFRGSLDSIVSVLKQLDHVMIVRRRGIKVAEIDEKVSLSLIGFLRSGIRQEFRRIT